MLRVCKPTASRQGKAADEDSPCPVQHGFWLQCRTAVSCQLRRRGKYHSCKLYRQRQGADRHGGGRRQWLYFVPTAYTKSSASLTVNKKSGNENLFDITTGRWTAWCQQTEPWHVAQRIRPPTKFTPLRRPPGLDMVTSRTLQP